MELLHRYDTPVACVAQALIMYGSSSTPWATAYRQGAGGQAEQLQSHAAAYSLRTERGVAGGPSVRPYTLQYIAKRNTMNGGYGSSTTFTTG